MSKIDTIFNHIDRVQQSVDAADCIITWREVIAVALRFDSETMMSPVVICSVDGRTDTQMMLRMAEGLGLLIIDDGRLLSICCRTEEGKAVPPDQELIGMLKQYDETSRKIKGRGQGGT